MNEQGTAPSGSAQAASLPPAQPPPSAAAGAPRPRGVPRQRRRLVSFFKTYAPGQMGAVDSTLNEFKGREDALFRGLVQRYGPEPPLDDEGTAATCDSSATTDGPSRPTSPGGPEGRRVRVMSKPVEVVVAADPSEPATTANALSATPGGGAVALRRPDPDGAASRGGGGGGSDEEEGNPYADLEWSQANLAALLVAFYGHVDPSVVARAPREAQHYYGREYDLFDRLHRIYGSSPVDLLQARAAAEEMSRHRQTSVVPPALKGEGRLGATSTRVEIGGDRATKRRVKLFEARLTKFYEIVAPAKLANAGQLAAMFGGSETSEEQLLKRLEQQYGRRPVALSEAETAAALASSGAEGPNLRAIAAAAGGPHQPPEASASRVEVMSDEGSTSRAPSHVDPTSPVDANADDDDEDTVNDAARRPCKRGAVESSGAAEADGTNSGIAVVAAARALSKPQRPKQPLPAAEAGAEGSAPLAPAAESLADDAAMDVMDDAMSAMGTSFGDFNAQLVGPLWSAHTELRLLVSVAELEDAEDQRRRDVDVAEYAGFAAIKSERRRAEQAQRLMAAARSSTKGVPRSAALDDEASAQPHQRSVYSAFDMPRQGVRCYRSILEADTDL